MSGAVVQVSTHGPVGWMRLDRPQALNALNLQVMAELNAAADAFEADPAVGCLVIAGSDKAFAAGGDIKEMQSLSFAEAYLSDFGKAFDRLAEGRKPKIAAVKGLALGGGCELALLCDFILAADTARFGQPEIKVGILPGAGGTQRLTRAIGKAKAMELCLTGRTMDAVEAERSGLVARVVAADRLEDEVQAVAEVIAGMSRPVAMMVRESVNRAFETTLAEGMRFERRLLDAAFALADQKEGMAAFVDKRRPNFRNT